MPAVEVFRESRLTTGDILDLAPDHVALATGADWRPDRFDGKTYVPVAADGARIHTPDDIMDGDLPEGPTLVFDTDGYYMAGVIAEKLATHGLPVTYVTDRDSVSAWAGHTAERWRIRTRLMGLGVAILPAHTLTQFDGAEAILACAYTGAQQRLAARSAVLVTQRSPRDGLWHDLKARGDLPFTLQRLGDCEAPAIIAAAVHAGHRYATELEEAVNRDEPLRHDRPLVAFDMAPPRASSPEQPQTALTTPRPP